MSTMTLPRPPEPRFPADDPPPGCVGLAAFAPLAELGLTYRRLDYWTRTGILEALPPRRGGGTGYARYWPEGEVAIAAAICRLTDAGLSVNAARGIARCGPRSREELTDGLRIATDERLWSVPAGDAAAETGHNHARG